MHNAYANIYCLKSPATDNSGKLMIGLFLIPDYRNMILMNPTFI